MTRSRLDRAFPIVAAALGNHLGVRVQVYGDTACTDGHLIILPQLEDPDETLQSVAWGYLAHEAAHVRYTDFDCIAKTQPEGILRSLFNIIEDVRIEKAITEDYPGTQISIERTLQHLIDTSNIAPQNWTQAPSLSLEAFCLFNLRVSVCGQRSLIPLLEVSHETLQQFLDPKTLQQLKSLLGTAPDLTSTHESLRLAESIRQLLDFSHDNLEKSRQADAGGSKDAQDSPSHSTPMLEATLPMEGHFSLWNEGPHLGDLFAPIRQQMEQAASDHRGLGLPIADRPKGNEATGRLQLERIRLASRALATSLYGFVQSERMDRQVAARKGRRILRKKLSRSIFGDDRIYLRAQRRIKPATAIHVLLDRSPSMSASVATPTHATRRRIDLAWEATLALALALESIPGVNTAITAFPGSKGLDERVYEVMAHGERLSECTDRLDIGTDGSTPLSEALLYGISRLLMTPEPRKIVLVLTDGIPNDPLEVHKILKQCADIGVEVYGIGLDIDIHHLFEMSMNIQTLQELQPRLFEWSKSLFTVP